MDRPSDRPGTSGYRRLPTTTQSTTTIRTTIKTTTEDFLPQLLDGLQIDDRFKYFRNELRKKRGPERPRPKGQNYHHFECPSNEVEVTTTPKPNGFWCSPFYLRLNPMEYFYCKLTGHQNLHFF